MRIEFDLTGTDRKALAKAISEIIGVKAVYKYLPTYAYEIDYFTVTRDGALEFDDRADSEEIETLLEKLEQKGFRAEPAAAQAAESALAEEVPAPTESTAQGAPVGLTVAMPFDKVNVSNLTNLLDAKGRLIQKALGINATPIEIGEETMRLPENSWGV